jgi:hypothetical protein
MVSFLFNPIGFVNCKTVDRELVRGVYPRPGGFLRHAEEYVPGYPKTIGGETWSLRKSRCW